MEYRVRTIGVGDDELVLSAGELFDELPRPELVADFLNRDGHHLLFSLDADGVPVGFVSGVEIVHPDKPVEMFVYELGVDEAHRRRGIAAALLEALGAFASESGMRGLWVITEPNNVAARATYRSLGADEETTVTFDWVHE